jgi:hypothetical protein
VSIGVPIDVEVDVPVVGVSVDVALDVSVDVELPVAGVVSPQLIVDKAANAPPLPTIPGPQPAR